VREEVRVNWLHESFKLVEGNEAYIIYSPDSPKHFLGPVPSSGFPLKILELHSKDDERAVATVFSYNLGMRFLIVFDIQDVRPL
jgi:hypothetical protein